MVTWEQTFLTHLPRLTEEFRNETTKENVVFYGACALTKPLVTLTGFSTPCRFFVTANLALLAHRDTISTYVCCNGRKKQAISRFLRGLSQIRNVANMRKYIDWPPTTAGFSQGFANNYKIAKPSRSVTLGENNDFANCACAKAQKDIPRCSFCHFQPFQTQFQIWPVGRKTLVQYEICVPGGNLGGRNKH